MLLNMYYLARVYKVAIAIAVIFQEVNLEICDELQYNWGVSFFDDRTPCNWTFSPPNNHSALLIQLTNILNYNRNDLVRVPDGSTLSLNLNREEPEYRNSIWCGWFANPQQAACMLDGRMLEICNKTIQNSTHWPPMVSKTGGSFHASFIATFYPCSFIPITTTATHTTSILATTTQTSSTDQPTIGQVCSSSRHLIAVFVLVAILGIAIIVILVLAIHMRKLRHKVNSLSHSTNTDGHVDPGFDVTNERMYATADPHTQGEDVENVLYQPLDVSSQPVSNKIYESAL